MVLPLYKYKSILVSKLPIIFSDFIYTLGGFYLPLGASSSCSNITCWVCGDLCVSQGSVLDTLTLQPPPKKKDLI